MPNATGAFTKLAIKKATTWGTAATGDYLIAPAKTLDFEPRQPYLDDPIIGLGREARRPARDVKDTTGRLQVPLDSRYIGHWLCMLLGAPTTTGASSPYTHVFKSSAAALALYSAEKQFLNLTTPLYALAPSLMVNGATLRCAPQGLADVDLDVLFSDSVDSTSSGAGTPTELTYTRFYQFDATLKKDGSDWAKITSVELQYRNNLEPARYIGGAGAIGDIDVGLAQVTGTLEARLNDGSIGTLADAATVFDLQVVYTKSANEKLTIELEQCELTRNGRPVNGPGGVSQSFQLFGSKDLSEGQMLTATLINDVASYA